MTVVVALLKPEVPGNVGSVARVMANFGFSELVLVSPRCDPFSEEARRRAKHGLSVLERAVVVDDIASLKADLLVGTSAKIGSDYNLMRVPLSPREVASRISGFSGRIVFLFGPESSGLLNDELALCDFLVTIPASDDYPVLNLSHSVAVILYELFLSKKPSGRVVRLAGSDDKSRLFSLIDEVLDSIPFSTPFKRRTQKVLWRRVLGKAFLTRREFVGLMGFFKKLKK